MTADEWYIARVDVYSDGTGTCLIGHDGGASGDLKVVAEYTTAPITSTDLFYAVLMCENRTAAANVREVDYMNAEGFRDWSV